MLLLYVMTVSEPSVTDHKHDVNFPEDEPRLDELVFQSQYPGPGSPGGFPYLVQHCLPSKTNPGSCVGAICRHPDSGLFRKAECRPCQLPGPHCVKGRSWTDRYGRDVTWLCEYGF